MGSCDRFPPQDGSAVRKRLLEVLQMSQSLAETHPSPELLRRFGSGELRGPEADAIEDHVETCAVCCQRLRELPRDPLLNRLQAVVCAGDTKVPPTSMPNQSTPSDPHASAPPDGSPVPQTPSVPAALAEHPRYRVLKALGSGGMGTVYLAEHKVMKRPVALKVIRPDLTARPEVIDRFRREVEAAARLSHPNIVTSYDAEQAGDCLFLVMEYVEGTDLAAWLALHGPLPVPEACDYVRQAALGLQHAHERGMVHRDLKPQNLMRTATGQVKVLDFGLARLVELAQEGGASAGMLLGTPDYMAPEQANDAHSADIRADVYSLGCTLYQLLGGQVPFPCGGLMDKLRRHAQEQPESLARLRPDLAAPLVAVVEGMMAKDPAQRPQTPAEVAAALAPWCQLLAHVSNGPASPSVPKEKAGQDPLPASHRPGPDIRSRKRWHRFIRQPVFQLATVGLVLVLGAGLAYFAIKGPGPEHRQTKVKAGDPAPDLSRVIPLIDDDFSVPEKYFDSGRQETYGVYRRYEGGRYVLGMEPRDGNGDRCNHIHLLERLSGDFACEVTGRLLAESGDQGWALSFCHRREPGHFTTVQLLRDGGVEVGTILDGQPIATLVPPIRHKAIHSGKESNTLLVVCRGDRVLEVYVNGSAIGPPIELAQPLRPVYPGLMYWQRCSPTEAGRAEFTRFRLWRLPRSGP